MNEQRRQAYLDLTRELLACDSSRASQILAARREWVDDCWVEMLERAADKLAEQGKLEGANKIYVLRDNAALLVALERTKTALPFWNEVWQVILENNCAPQILASWLPNNLDKLDDYLARAMQHWAVITQSLMPPEQKAVIAALLVNFSNFMFGFPLGSRASNLEIAIAGYEIGLDVFTEEQFPKQWAIAQNSLGAAYNNRIRGERPENLEQAIAHYQNALRVYSQEAFPEQWAMIQNNLGTAYSIRIVGEQAGNLEQAIICHQNALRVYTYKTFRVDWAMVQHNLGLAYSHRIQGEQAENVERAIACFRKSLRVRTRNAFPREWAETQKNLGVVYWERQRGNRGRNLECAINYLQNALQVYTQIDFPEKWAETQKNLGVVYWQRLEGERAENLERALACYQNALQIYTQAEFPEPWAETQNALAVAYRDRAICLSGHRIPGERNPNLERAIDCCQAALQVRTQAALPRFYAETQLNLGLIYRDMQQFHLAYDAFAGAIDTVESLHGEILSGDIAKRKLAEEWHQLYINIVEVCLKLAVAEPEYLERAIAYVERSKTRTLVELILSRDINRLFPPDVAVQVQQLQDKIHQGQQYIQSGTVSNPTALAQRLQLLRQQRNELQNRYLAMGSGFELGSFQATLDEHTAVIEWYLTDERILAFIITSGDRSTSDIKSPTAGTSFRAKEGDISVLQSAPEDVQALNVWVREYLKDYYEDKNRWQRQLTLRLEQLTKILHVERLLAMLPEKCNRLILIPHRFLHLLPLHALPVESARHQEKKSTCLLERFSSGIRYAPSCQLLQLAQTRQRSNFTHLFAIQNPTDDLAYAELEVESIRDNFEVTAVFQKAGATKEAIANSPIDIVHCLHFACNGFFDLFSPLDSGLQLADGSLTLAEIVALDLQQTRLVTLSACETGLTDPTSISDEYIGLPSGFLYAGSPSTVSSLWQVNDLSTAFLTIRFYQNLQNGYPVDISLNQAQLWLRDATKAELERWVEENRVLSRPALRIIVRRYLHHLPDNDSQPFRDCFYWAGFCAIGS